MHILPTCKSAWDVLQSGTVHRLNFRVSTHMDSWNRKHTSDGLCRTCLSCAVGVTAHTWHYCWVIWYCCWVTSEENDERAIAKPWWLANLTLWIDKYLVRIYRVYLLNQLYNLSFGVCGNDAQLDYPRLSLPETSLRSVCFRETLLLV